VERLQVLGARGFVPKSADADHLLAAIRAVYAGKQAFPHACQPVTQQVPTNSNMAMLNSLSVREREIIGLVRAGLTTRQIAERLSLAEFTVSTHRRNIMHKLELHNTAGLVQFAHNYGLQ
jgi:DNA-binding NarL/FixJ family response regulator